MSTETNAAATLVVDINTKPALDNLQALEQKYAALQAAFGKSNEGAVVSQKQLDDVKRLTKEIEELKSTIESLKQKAKEGGEQVGNMFQAGLQSGAGSFKLSKLVLPEDQQKLIAEKFGKLGLEGAQALVNGFTNANFAKQNQALLYLEQNTEKSLKKIQGMMRAAQDVASTFGKDTARAKFGDLFFDPSFKAKIDQQLAGVQALRAEAEKSAEANRRQSLQNQANQQVHLRNLKEIEKAEKEAAAAAETLRLAQERANSLQNQANQQIYLRNLKELAKAEKEAAAAAETLRAAEEKAQSLRNQANQALYLQTIDKIAKAENEAAAASVAAYQRQIGVLNAKIAARQAEVKATEAQQAAEAKLTARRASTLDTQAFNSFFSASRISEAAQAYAGVGKSIFAASEAVKKFGEDATKAMLGSKGFLVGEIDRLDTFRRKVKETADEVRRLDTASIQRSFEQKSKLTSRVNAETIDRQLGITSRPSSQSEYYLMSGATPAYRPGSTLAAAEAAAEAQHQKALAAAVTATSNAKRDARGSTTALTQANQAARDAAREHKEQQAMLHSTLRGVAGGLDNLWLTYGRFIPQMVSAYAAVSAFRKAATEGIQFDYQTQFISALGGDRALSAQNIQDQLLGIQGSPANVNELATSLRVLQQTGIDAAEGMGLLKTVISASTLGETSLKVAAEDIVGVLEVFNLHSEDPLQLASNFRKAGDVMAYVAQETKANLHDVAAGMQAATGVASQYGVSLEFAAASLAALGKQGIVGPKSGTFFRNFIEELYQPKSKKAENAMRELGVSAYDETGKAREALEIIKEMVAKLKEYKAVARDSLVADIFGERGAKQFRAIATDLDEFINKINEAGTANGLLETQTAKLAETTQYQLQQLKADYDNLFIKTWSDDSLAAPIQALRNAIGDADLQQLFRSVVQSIVEFGTTLALNIDKVLLFGKAVASWLAFQTVHGTVAVLTTTIGSLAPVVGLAATALAGGSVAMQTFGAVAMGTATTMAGRTGLVAALSTVAPAAAGVVGALGPIAVVLGTVGAAWYVFRDRTAEAMESAADAAAKGADRILASLARITNEIHDVPVAVSAAAVRNEKTSAKLMGETNEQNLKQLQRQYPELRGKSDEDLRTYLKGYVYEGWDGVVQNHGGAAPQAVEAYLKGVSSYQRTLGEISAAEAAVEMKKRESAQSDYNKLMQGAVGAGVKDRAPKPDKGAKAAAKDSHRADMLKLQGSMQEYQQLEKASLSTLESMRSEDEIGYEDYWKARLTIANYYTDLDIALLDKQLAIAADKSEKQTILNKKHLAEQAKAFGNEAEVNKARTKEAERASDAISKVSTSMNTELSVAQRKALLDIERETADVYARQRMEIDAQVESFAEKRLAEVMSNKLIRENPDALSEAADEINRQAKLYREQLNTLQQIKNTQASNPMTGIVKAWEEWKGSALHTADVFERSFSTVFKKIDDVMLDFVRTGKLNFKSLGQTIKDEVIKLLYELTVKKFVISLAADVGGLVTGLLGGGTSGSGSGSGSNTAAGIGGVLNNLSTVKSIYGVYQGGQAAYTAYTGTSGLTSGEAGAAAWQYLQSGDWGTALGVYLKSLTGTSTTAASSTAAAGSTGASTGAMGLSTALGYMAVIALAFQALTASKTRYLDTSITGTLGPDGLKDGRIGDRYKYTGNLLDSGGTEQNWRPLVSTESELREYYKNAYQNFNNPTGLNFAGFLRPYFTEGAPAPDAAEYVPNRPLYQGYTQEEIERGLDRQVSQNYKPYSQDEIDQAFADYMSNLGQYSYENGKFLPSLASGMPMQDELAQGGALKAAFEAIYKGAKSSLESTAKLFGDDSLGEALKGYVSQINIKTSGSIADAIGKYADELISGMGAAWLPTVESLRRTAESDGKKTTETWSQAFSRLTSQATVVDATLKAMGSSLLDVFGRNNVDNILKMSDALVQTFGGVANLQTAFDAYYNNFYSEQEKSARSWDQIGKSFAALNLSTPKTREEFRKLVEAQDLSTTAGQAAFKGLMDLQGVFAQMTPAVGEVATAADNAAEKARELAEALLEGFSDNASSLKAEADRNLATLKKAAQLERDRIVASQEAASERLNELRSLFDLLKSSVADLYGNVESVNQQQADTAVAFIRQAALTAQTSGYLPDQDKLSEAITAARSGLDRPFATEFDKRFATLTLAGNLDQLKAAAGKQIPVAERALAAAEEQLKVLDDLLASYEQQIDALFSIDDSVIGVQGSVADMGKAIVEALRQNIGALNNTILTAIKNGTVGTKEGTAQLTGVPKDQVTEVGGKKYFVSSQGAVASEDGTITANNGWKGSIENAKKIVAEAYGAMKPADFYSAAKSVGLSAAMIDAMYGFPSGTANDWAKANGLPSFAVGANRIPQDMLAVVHKDEAIIPAPFNPWVGGVGGSGTRQLEKTVEGLTMEVQRLQSLVAVGNRHAERTATVLDDASRGRQPLITEAVV